MCDSRLGFALEGKNAIRRCYWINWQNRKTDRRLDKNYYINVKYAEVDNCTGVM